MKIFNKSGDWTSKVNFVDENNVVLGYDTERFCCESAGWYVSDNKTPTASEINNAQQVLDDEEQWRFDTTFFAESSDVVLDEKNDYNPLDSGGVATFRIVNTKGQEKFIHLFNCHNGYYGHGFEFKDGETSIQGGCL